MVGDASLTIRPAESSDREAVLQLARRSLGWAGDERDRAFFAWKHDQNVFGSSPAWVACVDREVVGFRTFMLWKLARRDRVLSMVRAVDTATDPAHQGAGIFKRLTMTAIEELRERGIDAVFNTPNASSRPGYLKMGWIELGRPTLAARPSGFSGAMRMLRSRVAAEKWSEPSTVGEAASDALRDASAVDRLLGTLGLPDALATPRSAAYLQWRYGFGPLHYRALEVRDGLAIFRVRRRGAAREVTICEWLAPRPDRRAMRILARAGDYAVAGSGGLADGLIPVPKLGPIVTWRALATSDTPSLDELDFTVGDLELF